MKKAETDKEIHRIFRSYVYYVECTFNGYALADDAYKFFMIKAMGKRKKLAFYELYGFVVMDDMVRMLLGIDESDAGAALAVLHDTLEIWQTLQMPEGKMRPMPEILSEHLLPVGSRGEAAELLCYMHLSPVNRDCCRSGYDWWWSSYSTYRGRYNWEMVNTAPILQYLSPAGGEKARAKFNELHRSAERHGNPEPDCLKAADPKKPEKPGKPEAI